MSGEGSNGPEHQRARTDSTILAVSVSSHDTPSQLSVNLSQTLHHKKVKGEGGGMEEGTRLKRERKGG